MLLGDLMVFEVILLDFVQFYVVLVVCFYFV